MAGKNPDERIEILEKHVRNYKVLSISMMVLVLVMQRNRIVSWIDKMESWFGQVSNVKS